MYEYSQRWIYKNERSNNFENGRRFWKMSKCRILRKLNEIRIEIEITGPSGDK
jgi:hypothetical protein